MTRARVSRENARDDEKRLREAIAAWQPDRPRRWLTKHGGLKVERRPQCHVVVEQYISLRDDALARVTPDADSNVSGLPSGVCHFRLLW